MFSSHKTAIGLPAQTTASIDYLVAMDWFAQILITWQPIRSVTAPR
jgi:hypothetical protein